jgi:hypothetical protein
MFSSYAASDHLPIDVDLNPETKQAVKPDRLIFLDFGRFWTLNAVRVPGGVEL